MRRALGLGLLASAACHRAAAPATDVPAAAPTAVLEIDVVPPEGISIWLDGRRVATRSPHRLADVTPGAHGLEVRGMGYFPVVLPLDLRAGATLAVPVALRPRPALEGGADAPPEDADRGAAANAGSGDEAAASRRERPVRAVETPVELPPGVAPVELHLVPQPPTPLWVDGNRTDGRALRLHRARGVLQVGAMAIPYSIDAGRVLALTVPDDGAQWSKDGVSLSGGQIVRLSYGVARLERVTAPHTQVLLLRRAN